MNYPICGEDMIIVCQKDPAGSSNEDYDKCVYCSFTPKAERVTSCHMQAQIKSNPNCAFLMEKGKLDTM